MQYDPAEEAAARRRVQAIGVARRKGGPNLPEIMPGLMFHSEFEAMTHKRHVIDGFLAEGEVSCFFGEPGATKGTIAVDIACHVAAGKPWMGRSAGAYVGDQERLAQQSGSDWWPAGVLYIALERYAQVQRRVEAFTDEHGLKEPLDLAIWQGPLDLVNSPYDDIVAAIHEHHSAQEDMNDGGVRDVKLIVIDTLARTFGSGSDSGGEETAAVARKLERVLTFYPAAHILIVHHTPIGDDSRMRGHGNLLAAFDQTVRVRKHKAGSTAMVMKDNETAEDAKLKFAYALKSRTIHVCERTGKETTAPVVVPMPVDAIRLPAAKAAKADKTPSASKAEQPVLDALAGIGAPATEDQWRAAYDDAKDAETAAGTHRTRFWRGKESLVAKGLVSVSDGTYSVTETASQIQCDA